MLSHVDFGFDFSNTMYTIKRVWHYELTEVLAEKVSTELIANSE
jgi:hypothetical protein